MPTGALGNLALSALDWTPVHAAEPPGQAIRNTVELAVALERLGYARYWMSEHHDLGPSALGAPEVVIGQIAAATERIRVGAGGMLLPNHRPLHVAEQFRALEALHPGRIDLGVGRSEGARDAAVLAALQRPDDSAHGEGFDAQLDALLAFGGVIALPDGHPAATVDATPQDVPLPPVTLLGSSPDSATTAARRGLAYGFASYSNPSAMAEAIAAYKRAFVPHAHRERPHAFVAVRVLVGEDDAHAEAIAAPATLAFARFATGTRAPLSSVEEALAHRWSEAERAVAGQVVSPADVTGGPERVRARLEAMAAETGADELLTVTMATPADRLASYARLAAIFGLGLGRSARPLAA